MTNRLQGALDELGLVLNISDPATCVQRVGLTDDGCLSLTVTGPAGPRWFLIDDRGVVELHPARDGRIPLAKTLEEHDRILTYRPRRRLVLERDAGDCTQVLKGFRRRRSEEAARRHRTAEEAARKHSFLVPQLIAQVTRSESLVFSKLEGTPLSLRSERPDVFQAIGESLAVFQNYTGPELVSLFTHEDELRVLDRWESSVQRIQGRLPAGWRACRDELDAARRAMPSPQWGLCHRDLHDGQFLLTPRGVALLDFDLLCRADIALDPANLVAHFALRALQDPTIGQGAVEQFTAALMRGLGRGSSNGFWTRIQFYEASACLRLALVYAIRPRWSHLAPQLTELAALRLSEIEVLL